MVKLQNSFVAGEYVQKTLNALLNGLCEKEFVTRDETSYAVYDRFFEKWLRDKY
ncbi:MAG: hypothetical protein LBR10_01590 [Prevotellaceae bacterium]|jgi:hypothetical protein|nr:hypothetical protein [Prevotellaceae bacterium]